MLSRLSITADTSTHPVVIAIASPKGGAGKTTLAINLTAAMGRMGWQCILYDLDPLQEAVRWAINTPVPDQNNFTPLEQIVPSAQSELEEGHSLNADILQAARRRNADMVIIDCPSSSDYMVMNAIKLADLVVVPTALSALDLERTSMLMGKLDMLKGEQASRAELVIVPVLLDGQDSPSELALLAKQAVLAPTLLRRPDFLDVLAPVNSAGEEEVAAIARLIMGEIGRESPQARTRSPVATPQPA